MAKKNNKHSPSRNMEKRRNFVGFFFSFQKNKNRQKIASVEENNPYKHKRRQKAGRHREREKKKRLVEADDEEEEAHYILYQKHIFKVNSQPKKNYFRMCFFFFVSLQSNLTSFLLPSFMLSYVNCLAACSKERGGVHVDDDKRNVSKLTFRHWPHLIFTKFSESRMMFDTTFTLFSSESIIDRLSAAETAIEVLFKGTWFVRLEVSRCKGSGIWIECPCCSFWWSFWKVCRLFYINVACVRMG